MSAQPAGCWLLALALPSGSPCHHCSLAGFGPSPCHGHQAKTPWSACKALPRDTFKACWSPVWGRSCSWDRSCSWGRSCRSCQPQVPQNEVQAGYRTAKAGTGCHDALLGCLHHSPCHLFHWLPHCHSDTRLLFRRQPCFVAKGLQARGQIDHEAEHFRRIQRLAEDHAEAHPPEVTSSAWPQSAAPACETVQPLVSARTSPSRSLPTPKEIYPLSGGEPPPW